MSASESSCAPRSLVLRVRRATLPSSASRNMPRNSRQHATVSVFHPKISVVATGMAA